MEGKIFKCAERCTAIFFYISAIQMMISTGVSNYFFYNIQIFIILAGMFCLGVFLYLLFTKKILFYIQKGFILFLFALFLSIISTVKYIVSLTKCQGITFFTVYQIVIFSIYGFCVYIFISEKKERLATVSFLICSIESILILCFHNKFMLDLGIYRFLGIYDNPNIQGLFAVICSMLSIYLISKNYGFRIISILNFSLYLSVIVLTYSRTCMAAWGVGICIFGIFGSAYLKTKSWRKKGWNFVRIIFLSILFYNILLPTETDKLQSAIIGTGRAEDQVKQEAKNEPKVNEKDGSNEENIITEPIVPSETNVQMEDSEKKKESSTSLSNEETSKEISKRFSLSSENGSSIIHNLRFQIWMEYLLHVSDYYLLGTDYTLTDRPQINGEIRDPHNTILYTFFRYGILGVTLLVVLLAAIGVKLLIKKSKTGSQVALLSCFCSICMISIFNDLLNTPIYFFVLGITYLIMHDKEKLEQNMKPLRVLQVFSSLNRGGAESRTMDIYRRIEKDKIQFDFAVTSPEVENHFFYDEIIESGGKIHEIRSWKKSGIVGYFKQWKSILIENNYKIVHAHVGLESGIILYFSWLNDIEKRIAHARDSGVYDVSRRRRYYLYFARILTNIFSTVKIYCSAEAADHVFGKRVYSKKNSYFLPNAIDLELYKYMSDKHILEKKKELNLDKFTYIIGTVGNGRTVKNHIFLVKVFHKFLKLESNSALIIIGNDEQDTEAKQYVREQGIEEAVYFLGVRTDISELLHTLNVFVLPSLTEGAPGSVIEAQAANIPCILSDTITRSVDVESGLVKYLSLDAPLEEWAEQLLYSCQMRRPNNDMTIKKLTDCGYDINYSVEKLMNIYGI